MPFGNFALVHSVEFLGGLKVHGYGTNGVDHRNEKKNGRQYPFHGLLDPFAQGGERETLLAHGGVHHPLEQGFGAVFGNGPFE